MTKVFSPSKRGNEIAYRNILMIEVPFCESGVVCDNGMTKGR